MTRRLRADAALNRDRILDAATELFAARGIAVPLDEVARHAGVGVATLYRRFPTRADLAAATFERNLSRYTDAVDRALADADPWRGFRTLVYDLCQLQASDAGLRELLTMSFPASSIIEKQSGEALAKLGALMERAKAVGALRPDLVPGDVVVMLLGNAAVVTATPESAPGAEPWRRFAALILNAFAVTPSEVLPPAQPEQQLRRSIAMLAQ
ncbi:TetR family transcriptional regulator [Mycobacterium sp. MS1601]|uniref:TetR/AcrR family transcriptional regulator n=1 Tax=Mycobacterium sp. MS1601 TaxID=1936029 RepID=UPI0009793F82|nr:TetR/AcrR family transcriptional regulator [Mycobacterium sp. MS1601]AQA01134.1 TetR family transcriptional regulator [Mycobacterium sp. MS1601]